VNFDDQGPDKSTGASRTMASVQADSAPEDLRMMLTDVKSMRFAELDIQYDDRVLAPREWTAQQSTWAAELLATAPPGSVLEICAGVGHIGLLAVAKRPRDLVQVDLSVTACEYARANAAAAGLPVSVTIRQGQMDLVLEPAERFALIIADPPWLATAQTPDFPDDPLFAVDGGTDGLDVARLCIRVIADHLDEGGSALIQLGSEQQVSALDDQLAASGLRVVETRTYGDRGVVAHLER
jgi:release factor glutamine methyltransferase